MKELVYMYLTLLYPLIAMHSCIRLLLFIPLDSWMRLFDRKPEKKKTKNCFI